MSVPFCVTPYGHTESRNTELIIFKLNGVDQVCLCSLHTVTASLSGIACCFVSTLHNCLAKL